MVKKVILVVVLTVLWVALGFCLGVGYGQATFQPQTITVTETIEIPAEPVIITLPPIEVVKGVSKELRYFRDTRELERFLEGITLIKVSEEEIVDCDDYAIALRDGAYIKGFYMSIQVVWDYRRPDTGGLLTKPNEGHALNSVIIGNELYFIEPQTEEYWLAVKLDYEEGKYGR